MAIIKLWIMNPAVLVAINTMFFCTHACKNKTTKPDHVSRTMSNMGILSVQAHITLIRLGMVARCSSTTASQFKVFAVIMLAFGLSHLAKTISWFMRDPDKICVVRF